MHAEAEKDFPALPLFAGIALGAGLTPLLEVSGGVPIILLTAVVALSSAHGAMRRMRVPMILFGLTIAAVASDRQRVSSDEIDRLSQAFDRERFVTIEGSVVDQFRCDASRCATRLENVVLSQDGRELRVSSLELHVPPSSRGRFDQVRAEAFVSGPDGNFQAFVKSPRLLTAVGTTGGWSSRYWRKRLSERMAAAGGDERGRGLAEAIALGDHRALLADRKEIYRDAGIYHLLVFSGMQITIAAALLLALFRIRTLPRTADWMLIGLSVVAPMIAGGAPSVARAALMIGIDAGSRIFHRPTSYVNLLFLSASIRLLVAPEEITDPSFLLTYCATAGLLLIAGSLQRRLTAQKVIAAIVSTAAAELLLASITRFFFYQWTAGSSVVTLIVSPIFTLILVLSLFAITAAVVAPPLVSPLLLLIAQLEDLVVRLCSWITARVDLIHVAPPPHLPLLVATFAAFLLMLALVPRRYRSVAVAPLLLSHVIFTRPQPPIAALKMLNVGQGDAVLIRSTSAVLLVDSGPPPRSIGLPLAVKRLAKEGVTELDALVITHAHPDHCGGATAVVRFIRVGALVVPRRQLSEPCILSASHEAARRGVRLVALDREESFRVGPVEVRAPRFRFRTNRLNNESLIVLGTIGQERIFLAGDIEQEGERFWVEELLLSEQKRTILKVAHHGSLSSSTERFLDALQPQLALISAGRRNAFGHPHPQVLERLRRRRIEIERTDQRGAVTIVVGPRERSTVHEFDSPF